MANKNIKADLSQQLFPNLKSYSVDEILAAGGTTAFANKMGKDSSKLYERLSKMPKEDFLTDQEVADALRILNEGK